MKKMMPWIVTALLAITLIAVVVVVLIRLGDQDKNDNTHTAAAAVEKKMTADEIVEVSSELPQIKTNLADPDRIIMVSFSFRLSDKTAKEDFDKIQSITVKPIIIQALADTKAEELNTAKGMKQFNEKLTGLINEALPEPNLKSTSISDIVIAPM